MEKGWIVENVGQYCSDSCLRSAFPNLDIEKAKNHADEKNACVYWTQWKSKR